MQEFHLNKQSPFFLFRRLRTSTSTRPVWVSAASGSFKWKQVFCKRRRFSLSSLLIYWGRSADHDSAQSKHCITGTLVKLRSEVSTEVTVKRRWQPEHPHHYLSHLRVPQEIKLVLEVVLIWDTSVFYWPLLVSSQFSCIYNKLSNHFFFHFHKLALYTVSNHQNTSTWACFLCWAQTKY